MTDNPSLPDAAAHADAGVETRVDGPVLTVTLNRPEVRNAQTPAMWRALASVGRTVPADVRVVVLRGQGESFSAGLDRAMLGRDGIDGELSFTDIAGLSADHVDEVIAGYQEGFTWWRDPRFVSVAVVQGHAVGAGFQLALACDLRVLADDAQLCMRETALGLVPDLGGTKPLVDAVGYARALEICATSRWVGAAEAAHLGLANVVVPKEALTDTVSDLVEALTTPMHAAVTSLKGLLQGASGRTYDEQRDAERSAQADRIGSLVRLLGAS